MRKARWITSTAIAVVLAAGMVAEAVAVERPAGANPDRAPLVVHRGKDKAAADAMLGRANLENGLRVIVGLAEGGGPVRGRQQALLARIGAGSDSATMFETIPFVAIHASPLALAKLLADEDVATIEEDVPARPALAESTLVIHAPSVWSATTGATGLGQQIAILDTGIDTAHPMLAGKIASEACFSSTVKKTSASLCPGGASSSTAAGSGKYCALQGCDHGTHVASIAAGNSSTAKGVAPDARVIAIQVYSRFDTSTYCGATVPCILSWTSDQIRALDYVAKLAPKQSIAAANLSLSGGLYSSACDASASAMKSSIDKLRSLGIATTVAAGNDGQTGSIGSPACITTAVAVGSTSDTTDTVSSFSNISTLVDMLAPGDLITAAVPGGAYAAKRGTSMAAPHAAGAFALLRQLAPTATLDQRETTLETTGLPKSRSGVTVPRFDLQASATALQAAATTTVKK